MTIVLGGVEVVVEAPSTPTFVLGSGTLEIVVSEPQIEVVVSNPTAPTFEIEAPNYEHVVVPVPGQQGIPGPPGTGSVGGANLFVQQTNPNMTGPGVWWETNPDGTLKTLWVENGLP